MVRIWDGKTMMLITWLRKIHDITGENCVMVFVMVLVLLRCYYCVC